MSTQVLSWQSKVRSNCPSAIPQGKAGGICLVQGQLSPSSGPYCYRAKHPNVCIFVSGHCKHMTCCPRTFKGQRETSLIPTSLELIL